jgi:hypothetical protein
MQAAVTPITIDSLSTCDHEGGPDGDRRSFQELPMFALLSLVV